MSYCLIFLSKFEYFSFQNHSIFPPECLLKQDLQRIFTDSVDQVNVLFFNFEYFSYLYKLKDFDEKICIVHDSNTCLFSENKITRVLSNHSFYVKDYWGNDDFYDNLMGVNGLWTKFAEQEIVYQFTNYMARKFYSICFIKELHAYFLRVCMDTTAMSGRYTI